jgi:hypothetical protein
MSTLIKPIVGAVYNFKFKSEFSEFDDIYKVVQILTYEEYVSNGGNLLSDFFEPVNKTQEDVDACIEHVRTCDMLKLTKPNEESMTETRYVSTYFLDETPDYNVKKYNNFGLIANVGIVGDVESLRFMKDNIKEAFESVLGITPKVSFVILNEKWLTDAQYEEVLAERDESKKKLYSYYAENLRLQKQVSQCNTKIMEYERLIISLQQQLEELTTVNGG